MLDTIDNFYVSQVWKWETLESLDWDKEVQEVYHTVGDVPLYYDLSVDSQDRMSVLEHLGIDLEDGMLEFGSLFTLQKDGDYVAIYGCSYNTPCKVDLVYRLK